MRASAGSLFGIVLAGVAGAIAAWAIVSALGWSGVAGAIAAVLLAMGIAVAVFALGIRALKSLGWLE